MCTRNICYPYTHLPGINFPRKNQQFFPNIFLQKTHVIVTSMRLLCLVKIRELNMCEYLQRIKTYTYSHAHTNTPYYRCRKQKGRKPVEKKGKSCSAIKIISNPYSTPQSSSIYIHLAKLSPNVRVSEWKKGKNTPLTTHQVPFTTHNNNNNKMAIYNHPNLFKAIFEKSSK